MNALTDHPRPGGCRPSGLSGEIHPREHRPARRDRGPAEDPRRLLARRRGQAASGEHHRSCETDPGPDGGPHPPALDALQLGDALAALLPADYGPGTPQGAGRGWRPGDPRGHGARPDALRRGSDRRPGRQARRDRVREQRHDAAQLRRDAARRTRRDRPARRVDGHPARRAASGTTCRPPTRSCSPAGCSSPARSQKLNFTAPAQAGRLPLRLHLPRPLAADVRGASTSSRTSTRTWPTRIGYLAAHPLPIARRAAQDNRPRKEWTFDDLASSVDGWTPAGRSATASSSSRSASCVSCHRMNGVGNEFGPDLTKLDPKHDPGRHPPQHSSSPRPRSTRSTRRTSSRPRAGKVVTGHDPRRDARAVKSIENPLAKHRAGVLKNARDRRAHSSRRPRSCPRACSTS